MVLTRFHGYKQILIFCYFEWFCVCKEIISHVLHYCFLFQHFRTSPVSSMEFASSTSKLPQMYDMLINFNGEDIHRKFVSHLDSVLSAAGLTTLLHHQNAVNDMDIQQPILNLCRVAIVVFTKTYSQSAWCLHQLQQIIEWHKTYYRHVLPVYYEIQPSDVRLQRGDFGKTLKATAQQSFSAQQLEHGMSGWNHALSKTADFFGWDESNYRSDAEVVDKIVKSVLNLAVLSATKFPVGLQSRMEEVIQIIKKESTKVCRIAICGKGGSGKTTLAKAIYDQIHDTFTEKFFIEDFEQKQLCSIEMGRSLIPERIYGKKINLMNPNESLELLSWHAFREAKPKDEYHFLAKRVVAYCGGLPLLLEVIGSCLYERTKEEWNNVLSRLERLPQHKVLEILKISFDGLPNQYERNLFLDICCFFVGKDRVYVTKILNGCGVNAESGIRILIERSLIIVKNNKFGLHPLLREMAREIVAKITSGKEPEKTSRLWFDKDVLLEHILFSSQDKKVIQRFPPKWFLTVRDFFKHDYLEVRDAIRRMKLGGHCEYRSKELGWIRLENFSSEFLPIGFLRDAIAIDLKHSLPRLVWKEPQVLASLTVLNLSHSKYLTETPDFSRLPSLEQLILKDCPRLCEVHQSIGGLCNLTLLNLKDCTRIKNLPREIYMLKSLKTLILSGCSGIHLMEKDIRQMESLITLITESTVMKQVPFSIVSSKSIGYLSLRGFEGLSHNLFPFIMRSWMLPSMNPLSYYHSFCMDVEVNSWDDIAPLLRILVNLRSVLLQCETEFQLSKQVQDILVEYGVNITESHTSKQHFRSLLIGDGRCKEFLDAFSDSISEVFAGSESCDVSLPGDNNPNCLADMGEGYSVSFTVPRDRDIKGMALCAVYLSTPEIVATEDLRSVLIVNYTKCTLHIHNHGTVIFFNDKDWEGIISNLGSGDKVEIFVIFGHGLVVRRTIVYLIFGESYDIEKESTSKKNSLIRFIKKL
ncbi:putative disease resistance protein At4g11170 isoform X2 [Vigna unguiculata]|uniref:putative disease resistance protein At4g11170 isoform X2 n=1 Tax=Vigna unguiculata TaxID=3917 RepID=UPI001016D793|nr:putative disease resistance protein At4g11170 isoform X2 [Vigna unguiculata]XP_027907535.1 putative disease resistance protein At4g11170 isoform X2 [Vigna unguiculata]